MLLGIARIFQPLGVKQKVASRQVYGLSYTSQALIRERLAGVCGNRTHRRRLTPTIGFEVQGRHQAPSYPRFEVILRILWSAVKNFCLSFCR